MSPAEATIVPIRLTVGGRTGITLWAPPWEEDGEEWQAFLGSGDKLEVFEDSADLATHLSRATENDLIDHPAWDMIQTLPASQLVPEADYAYDVDAVPGLVEGERDEETVSALADTCDMLQRIADTVDDGPLQHMLDSPVFTRLIDGGADYEDDEWQELAETVERSWRLLTERLQVDLQWHGSDDPQGVATPGRSDPARPWEDAGILPVALRLPAGTGYTLRCYLDDTAVFLGAKQTIEVFRRPAALLEHVRTAEGHDLSDLETWPEIRDAAVLDVSPGSGERYDLRTPGAKARETAADIADYARLDSVRTLLAGSVDDATWKQVLEEIGAHLQWHD